MCIWVIVCVCVCLCVGVVGGGLFVWKGLVWLTIWLPKAVYILHRLHLKTCSLACQRFFFHPYWCFPLIFQNSVHPHICTPLPLTSGSCQSYKHAHSAAATQGVLKWIRIGVDMALIQAFPRPGKYLNCMPTLMLSLTPTLSVQRAQKTQTELLSRNQHASSSSP